MHDLQSLQTAALNWQIWWENRNCLRGNFLHGIWRRRISWYFTLYISIENYDL